MKTHHFTRSTKEQKRLDALFRRLMAAQALADKIRAKITKALQLP